MLKNQTGVWLGLKPCGCPVAVTCAVDKSDRTMTKHVEQSKREFLREGLSVLYAPFSEWESKWLPIFKRECEHDKQAPNAPTKNTKEEGTRSASRQ